MVRRSTPTATLAERHFPVRVRISVPANGLGMVLNRMYVWLDEAVGRGRYWIGSEAGYGRSDAALFYFVDVSDAKRFVDQFSCGTLVRGVWVFGQN